MSHLFSSQRVPYFLASDNAALHGLKWRAYMSALLDAQLSIQATDGDASELRELYVYSRRCSKLWTDSRLLCDSQKEIVSSLKAGIANFVIVFMCVVKPSETLDDALNRPFLMALFFSAVPVIGTLVNLLRRGLPKLLSGTEPFGEPSSFLPFLEFVFAVFVAGLLSAYLRRPFRKRKIRLAVSSCCCGVGYGFGCGLAFSGRDPALWALAGVTSIAVSFAFMSGMSELDAVR